MQEYYLMALSQPRNEVVPQTEPKNGETGAANGSGRRSSGVYDRLVSFLLPFIVIRRGNDEEGKKGWRRDDWRSQPPIS